MQYQLGTHIIATLVTQHFYRIERFELFQRMINSLIAKYSLQKLGEVYHNFKPVGFTGVVCLSESHLSIHTWPEYGKVNIDIYLSNHLRTNDDTVNHLYNAIKDYLEATIENEQKLKR
jgi:S-adenosylmethionine decarboxylase